MPDPHALSSCSPAFVAPASSGLRAGSSSSAESPTVGYLLNEMDTVAAMAFVASLDRFDRPRSDLCIEASQDFADKRLVAKRGFRLCLSLVAFTLVLCGERSVDAGAKLECQSHLAAQGLVQYCLQLIDIGFIGKVALRFRQGKNELPPLTPAEFGLCCKLADNAGQFQASDKCRPFLRTDR